ncbi:unnamed protein product [Larinioides sclopetarius]|uniref:Uncharacterized protein n=1 Tax=Larinioides sclopetarius TaxID=280406 RepID=A0AAV2BZP1_9ARAC
MERSMDLSLEIKIKAFHSNKTEILKYTSMKKSSYTDWNATFSVSVFPDGVNKGTEGWLVILPNVKFKGQISFHNTVLSWIVSIIDANETSIIPRLFTKIEYDKEIHAGNLSDRDLSHAKYLKRSYILNQKDEFLTEGVLTLRCKIFLSWYGVLLKFPRWRMQNKQRSSFGERFSSMFQLNRSNNSYEVNTFTVSDVASDLSQGKPPSESIEGSTDNTENIWTFVTSTDKFRLSLDKRKNTAGFRLQETSPVMESHVKVAIEERKEKRIEIPSLDSETFRIILFFLMYEVLYEFGFYQLINVYKFSYLFEMENLQRRCAEELVKDVKPESLLEKELDGIANIYSDKYLSEILHNRRRTDDFLGSPCRDFFYSMPQSVFSKKGSEVGNSGDTFKVFDLTDDFSKLEQRYLFAEYVRCPRVYRKPQTELIEHNISLDENVWIFATSTDWFRLSLEKRKDSFGIRLLKASPEIRRKVNNVKAERKNRVELPEVDGKTFILVLFFLKSGTLYEFEFDELFKVYKFSYSYKMNYLQRRCAEVMFEEVNPKSFLGRELEAIAYTYSDKYLSHLLYNQHRGYFQGRCTEIISDDKECAIFFGIELSSLSIAYSDKYLSHQNREVMQIWSFKELVGLILQPFPIRNRVETDSSSDNFTDFDFIHDFCKSWIELNEDSTNITEHIWIFDTPTERFFLSLDERKDTLGTRFLKASPVIREYVEFLFGGREENYIALPKTDSETCKRVLYFLRFGEILQSRFQELVRVYTFSNFYQMEELQKRCVDLMVEDVKPKSLLEEVLEIIAVRFYDNYLSERLLDRRGENSESYFPPLRVDDTPLSDCYR